MNIKISNIIIKKRIRKDIGDLTQLKESLLHNGLINPITVNEKNILLAGYRRLQAVKELGWETIECRIIPAKTKIEKLLIEADENIGRKDFTEDELIALAVEKEYLSTRGLKKLKLWFMRFYKKISEWLRGFFPAKL